MSETIGKLKRSAHANNTSNTDTNTKKRRHSPGNVFDESTFFSETMFKNYNEDENIGIEQKASKNSSIFFGANAGVQKEYPKITEKVKTEFFHAAKEGNFESAQKMIETYGQNLINITTAYGYTPLRFAVAQKHVEVVRLLLEQTDIDVNKAGNDKETPLYLAIEKNDKETVELLLKHPNIDASIADAEGHTPLYIAAQRGDEKIVELLLKQPNIDVNKADTEGCAPIHMANEVCLRLLLNHPDIDVNKADAKGRTPLFVAIGDNEQSMGLLLEQPNIDVNKADVSGRTPLRRAVDLALEYGDNPKYIELVELLLKHPSIDMYKSDGNANTVLQMVNYQIRDPYGSKKKILELLQKKQSEEMQTT
jgi:ankyrin repeat protein